jgi:hypothetical protein
MSRHLYLSEETWSSGTPAPRLVVGRSRRLKPSSDNGEPLDAEFHVEELNGRVTLVLEARGGRVRNPDYQIALALLLSRLRDGGAVLDGAIVDSSVSRKLPFEQRVLRVRDRSFPIDLGAEEADELAVAIAAAQMVVAQQPNAKGGNRHKRIRLFLGNVTPEGLEARLANLTGSSSGVVGGSSPGSDPSPSSGQGRGLSAPQRRAVELRAMELVAERLEGEGWRVNDVSGDNLGYDLRARRGEEERHVEVKGTIGPGTSVLLTPNEVRHAREWPDYAALAVVGGIALLEEDEHWTASGGSEEFFDAWSLGDGELLVDTYEWRLP